VNYQNVDTKIEDLQNEYDRIGKVLANYFDWENPPCLKSKYLRERRKLRKEIDSYFK